MLLPLAFVMSLALPAPVSAPPGLRPIPAEFPLSGGPAVGFAGPAVIDRIVDLPLSAEAQAAFDTDFQSNGYFGAFALSKEGGWGFSSGTSSIEAAHEIALAQCTSLNGRCTVIAELVPQDYAVPPPGMLTLSQAVAGHFAGAAKNPRFQALAISEDGAFAMHWGMASQAEADAGALAGCEENRQADAPGLRDMPCVLVTNLP